MASEVIYWDASAILPLVLRNMHTEKARFCYRKNAVHLVSTLGVAEVCAVLSDAVRKGILTEERSADARRIVLAEPFQRILHNPDWDDICILAELHNLRGADLWHLALVRGLKMRYFPQARMLTYDSRLKSAAMYSDLAVLDE